MNDAIRPFKINISGDVLADLQQRLAMTRWPEAETAEDWEQGVPLSYLQKFCDYWQHSYDWRSREKKLNQFEQFMTQINGLDIHFVHVRSTHSDAVPLLITHGWPGSIVEFQKVIAPLTQPEAFGGDPRDAFHIICPSLPGYGFSEKPKQTGWGIETIAKSWDQLMLRLGYQHYFAQGGDWGSMVARAIGEQNLGHCVGLHINMVSVNPDPATMNDLTEQEQASLAGRKHYKNIDSGYSKIQSTKPQTIGYALTDSPVGQAAWILEKYWAWTDANGDPGNILSKDEMLDNIMLYWCTASAASSARLYWESFKNPSQKEISLPVGCSVYPKDIFRSSQRWAGLTFKNIIYWNELEKGGHFAAFEQPELFVNEIRDCFRILRKNKLC